MAYEIKDWKKPNCSLTLDTNKISDRETYSDEINKEYGGGGLNANYRTVEAIAIASNLLGVAGLEYGKDFVFKTGSSEEIDFDFCDKTTKELGKKNLERYLK